MGPLLSLAHGLQTQAFNIEAMEIGDEVENQLLSGLSSLHVFKPCLGQVLTGLDQGCWLGQTWAGL